MAKAKTPKIAAKRDFIWCKPGLEQVSAGGLIIPASAQDEENPRNGVVVAVGDGLVEGGNVIPLTVKVGDKIHFPRNSGTLVKIGDETFFVLRENQVFGVVE